MDHSCLIAKTVGRRHISKVMFSFKKKRKKETKRETNKMEREDSRCDNILVCLSSASVKLEKMSISNLLQLKLFIK